MRDDLESLGYTILSLLSDTERFWFDHEAGEHKYFIAEKKKFISASDIGNKYKGI